MAFTNGNDINILQRSDSQIISAAAGDDRYIVSADTLFPNQSITIADSQGINTLQLVGGLQIISSRVTSGALQLTLNNGAVITLLAANSFNYQTGGDGISGNGGAIQNFSTFVTQSLGTSIPAPNAPPNNGGGVMVNQNGGTSPISAPPGFNISLESAPATEGNTSFVNYTFRITRGGDLSAAASVGFDVQGTGVNPATGADFLGGAFPSGTVNFAANQSFALITVSVAGDTLAEATEAFLVSLRNPVGAPLGTNTTVTASIVDDDAAPQPVISIQTNGASALEGNAGTSLLSFNLTRTGDLSSSSTINFTVESSGVNPANAADFAGGLFPSGTVTFAQGQSSVLLGITVNGDNLQESNETFTVRLNSPTGATLGNSAAIGTIVNDDAPPPAADDFAANAGTTGAVAVGGSARGVIEVNADRDWFGVNLVQGQTYRIDLVRDAGTALDPFLRLFNSSGVQLAFNDDGPGTGVNSQITFTANASDRFFIEAGSFNSSSVGGYSVNVVQVAAPVNNPPANNPSRFDIDIDYSGPERFRSFFERAADRIEQIIVGDLPSATFQGRFVDDILISVFMEDIDGPRGILGSAGPDSFRSGSRPLPFHGVVELDNADADRLIGVAGFDGLVVHEMMHALGFGTMWDFTQYRFNSTFGRYTGANALREYQLARGTNEAFIPLETGGGGGSANSHWQDRLFFGEVMGAFYTQGELDVISRITVGALQDLGYLVDYAFADPFAFSSVSASDNFSENDDSEQQIFLAGTAQNPDLMIL